jgi:hypothetical protein
MGRLLVIVCLALCSSRALADTIAMLPLDGDKRLEIYGQPVAAEIARALKAAGVDVVVVGARMDVPDRAQLIVDGTIKSTKNKQIELSIRLRDPRDGTVLDTLPAPATKLDNLDKAAADLSARVVPSVKSHLEALAKAATPAVVDTVKPPEPQPPKPKPLHVPMLTTSTISASAPQLVMLRTALDRETALWAATQRYDAKLALEVLTYAPKAGKVPTAHARVRVRIDDGNGIKFDRIVRTDTIVGDRDAPPDQLAARTAREVLAIVQPHLRRTLKR